MKRFIVINKLLFTRAIIGLLFVEMATGILYEEPIQAVQETPAVGSTKEARWALAAYEYITTIECSQAVWVSEKECAQLRTRSRENMAVYVASARAFERYTTVLPEDDLEDLGAHDVVLAIDTVPEADPGHLVVVFFLDLVRHKDWCLQDGGKLLENGACLTLAYKRRCGDDLARRRSFARRCTLNFIPLVYRESAYLSPQQELTCRPQLAGFGPCPAVRSAEDTQGLICGDSGQAHFCDTSGTHHVHTNCRHFETCDQAVLIAGGWNSWTSRVSHQDSLWSMYRLVSQHGFHDANIKVFFANGHRQGIPKASGSTHSVFPAPYKAALRGHIQTLCSSPHCAESLVLYVTGPARDDGSLMLWDVDNNGVASDDELYKLEELLGDLANCKSRVVHLIADHSYSGELAKAAKRSKNHRNVAVYASSRDNEYAYASEFTSHWTRHNHTTLCMKDIYKEARKEMQLSNPDHEQGPEVARDLNIFGAPCYVVPPFSFEELHLNYLGCQSVPITEWLNTHYANKENSASSTEEVSRHRLKRDVSLESKPSSEKSDQIPRMSQLGKLVVSPSGKDNDLDDNIRYLSSSQGEASDSETLNTNSTVNTEIKKLLNLKSRNRMSKKQRRSLLKAQKKTSGL